jgi:hypothetical protein
LHTHRPPCQSQLISQWPKAHESKEHIGEPGEYMKSLTRSRVRTQRNSFLAGLLMGINGVRSSDSYRFVILPFRHQRADQPQ